MTAASIGTTWPVHPVRPRRGSDRRVNLSSNELIHPAVPHLVKRMTSGFEPADLTHYPVQDAPAESAAELLGRRPDEILLGPGSDSMIRLIVAAVRDHVGGQLLTQYPNYEAWEATAAIAGGWDVRRIGKPADGRWLPAIQSAADGCDRALVAVSWPNGPDGHLPDRRELAALADTCQRRGHLLVLDGCYAAFCGDHEWLARLADDSIVVLLSWSKMFGLAGGRLAVGVGGSKVVQYLRAFRQEDHVNTLMLSALTATTAVHDDFRAVWADIGDCREQARTLLSEAGHAVAPSGGNFLHVPLADAATSGRVTRRLSDLGYRVRDMAETPGLRHHMRFTVACGPVWERFLQDLEPLLSSVPPSEAIER
ncbi:aminotransferase class I/II-fold pyridoxal phosphate-dependent enzyme [Pseudonocardia phyllosphaerae]|uniref:aminotransferase class I/II-fold pyridoxal phosphate-dependent enzyme n=1 Tax=Pseudonocardia phyllosphaerae TaxID=3390502 RepID=UPI00397C881E